MDGESGALRGGVPPYRPRRARMGAMPSAEHAEGGAGDLGGDGGKQTTPCWQTRRTCAECVLRGGVSIFARLFVRYAMRSTMQCVSYRVCCHAEAEGGEGEQREASDPEDEWGGAQCNRMAAVRQSCPQLFCIFSEWALSMQGCRENRTRLV